jgi:hypothetical protein
MSVGNHTGDEGKQLFKKYFKPGMIVPIYNPYTQEDEVGECEVEASMGYSVRLSQKKEKKSIPTNT